MAPENDGGWPEDEAAAKAIAETHGVDIPTAPDNWKHRSKGMRCATCMWWVHKGNDFVHEDDGPRIVQVGRCRRRSPTMSGFPVAYLTDWCGDFKLDEEKVNG